MRGETQKWWVSGSTDVRHGSIHARGILSNVTGSRANEIQNDDVEVPSNIGTPEARAKLCYLDAIEGPLISGLMWCHVSILDTIEGENTSKQYKQMQQFNPAIKEQEDDHLDSLAAAVTDSPERLGKLHRQSQPHELPNWRTSGGVIEATLDFEH